MEIEIGESLFYSWLRHVRKCKIVQTNWKNSPAWDIKNSNEIADILAELRNYYSNKYPTSYLLGKKTSLSQIFRQGESDLLGVNNDDSCNKYYAIDVAFHRKGLNYGKNKEDRIISIIGKCVRSALYMYGYFNIKNGYIAFASPKVTPKLQKTLIEELDYVGDFFNKKGFGFQFELLSNDSFGKKVIDPILEISNVVEDSCELFLRSVQLIQMFKHID